MKKCYDKVEIYNGDDEESPTEACGSLLPCEQEDATGDVDCSTTRGGEQPQRQQQQQQKQQDSDSDDDGDALAALISGGGAVVSDDDEDDDDDDDDEPEEEDAVEEDEEDDDDDDDDDDEGPDCSAVSCLRPECENGQIPIVPEGECCPECSCQACATGEYNDGCNDCKCLDDGSVDCTDWRCFWQGIPKCSEEEPDCSAVSCIVPECKEGQVPIVPKGECCPQCSCEVCQNYSDGCNDCTCLANGEVACTDLYCFAPGEPSCNEPEKKQPSCETCWGSYYDGCNWCDCSSGEEVCDDVYCKRKSEAFCGVDCRMVLCAPSPPTCENGEEPTIPLGQCCPVCEDSPPPIDCSTVDCYFPLECESQGLFTVTQPGACCPECVDETYEPDCSAVTCPAPECQGDDQPFVPFGECCPVCPLTCDDCPGGYNDGCNECFCESDGSEGGCTERACLVQHAPFCIPVKEEEESVSDSIIEEEIGACTMDAKECPDGSFVGRDWSNNCEFEPCP
mmetsp:Transcript_19983/g.47692  ORF Transcript_19983/g.47692 Transcript_19983/m.47692 type:complete len:507 (+) Transcript_19983:50-1570(+)